MQAENIYRCRLTRTRHARYTNTTAITGIRKALFDNLLSQNLMCRCLTLHKSHGTAQHRHIALKNTLHKLRRSRQRLAAMHLQIRINTRWLYYTAIYCQSGVTTIVLGMFHIGKINQYPTHTQTATAKKTQKIKKASHPHHKFLFKLLIRPSFQSFQSFQLPFISNPSHLSPSETLSPTLKT